MDVPRHGPGLWHSLGLNRDLWDGIPSGPFDDQGAFADWLESRSTRPDMVLHAILDRRRGDLPVGLFFLLNVNTVMGTAEIGLIYGSGLSRSRGATEAFFLLADHVLGTLGYRRLEWRCNTANAASIAAARRYGFTAEGVLRQTSWTKGANWDLAVFSILDREWPPLRSAFLDWLDPGNFDGSGRQRRRLQDMPGRVGAAGPAG